MSVERTSARLISMDGREYIVILFDVQRIDPAKLTFLEWTGN